METNIYKKLLEVQTELKVPKNQYNNFGGYNYRSCEDILEALKPILATVGAVVTIEDEITMIGDRYYIKATAWFTDTESKDRIFNTAYAREEESKKGMDGSQVTGASSSYARKYALNGMFAIDDNKDSDFTNHHGKEEEIKASESQIKCVEKYVRDIPALLNYYHIDKLEDLTVNQASEIIRRKSKEG